MLSLQNFGMNKGTWYNSQLVAVGTVQLTAGDLEKHYIQKNSNVTNIGDRARKCPGETLTQESRGSQAGWGRSAPLRKFSTGALKKVFDRRPGVIESGMAGEGVPDLRQQQYWSTGYQNISGKARGDSAVAYRNRPTPTPCTLGLL